MSQDRSSFAHSGPDCRVSSGPPTNHRNRAPGFDARHRCDSRASRGRRRDRSRAAFCEGASSTAWSKRSFRLHRFGRFLSLLSVGCSLALDAILIGVGQALGLIFLGIRLLADRRIELELLTVHLLFGDLDVLHLDLNSRTEFFDQGKGIPLEERQSRQNDPALQRGIMGFAQRISKRKGNEQGSRGLDLLGYFTQEGDRNGSHAGSFEDALDQPDRLIADRSDRRQ